MARLTTDELKKIKQRICLHSKMQSIPDIFFIMECSDCGKRLIVGDVINKVTCILVNRILVNRILNEEVKK